MRKEGFAIAFGQCEKTRNSPCSIQLFLSLLTTLIVPSSSRKLNPNPEALNPNQTKNIYQIAVRTVHVLRMLYEL